LCARFSLSLTPMGKLPTRGDRTNQTLTFFGACSKDCSQCPSSKFFRPPSPFVILSLGSPYRFPPVSLHAPTRLVRQHLVCPSVNFLVHPFSFFCPTHLDSPLACTTLCFSQEVLSVTQRCLSFSTPCTNIFLDKVIVFRPELAFAPILLAFVHLCVRAFCARLFTA